MNTHQGSTTLVTIGLLAVLIIGTFAFVQRSVLKEYFQTGDKPSEAQFGSTIDSNLNMTDDQGMLGLKEYNPTQNYEAGDTVVKNDQVVRANTQTNVQTNSPVKRITEAQKSFTMDSAESVSFSWGPVTPGVAGAGTYRLKVWQLMQGQNATSAMRENKPVVTRDVTGTTETTVSGLYTGPCKPPYLCEFVWSVEAVTAASTVDHSKDSDASAGKGAESSTGGATSAATGEATGSTGGTGTAR